MAGRYTLHNFAPETQKKRHTMGTLINYFKRNLFGDDMFTRQDLSDHIFKIFYDSLKKNTTREGLLFDTKYVIYLPSDIYKEQEDSFAHTTREVVNRCHNVLRKAVQSYPNYKPHSRCWRFCFIKAVDDIDLGDKNKALKDDKIVVFSYLYVDRKKGGGAGKQEKTSCVMTILPTKGDRKKIERERTENISVEGVTVLDKDCFEVKFDRFEKVVETPVSDLDKTMDQFVAHAILKLKSGSFTDESQFFYMTKESLYVTGPKFNQSTLDSSHEVAVIDDDLPGDFTLHITVEKGGKFFITGDADTLLNESIHLSPDKLKPIQDNSSLMLFNGIQINFSIIK